MFQRLNQHRSHGPIFLILNSKKYIDSVNLKNITCLCLLQNQFSRTIRSSDGPVSQIPSQFAKMKDLESCRGEHLMGKNPCLVGEVEDLPSLGHLYWLIAL